MTAGGLIALLLVPAVGQNGLDQLACEEIGDHDAQWRRWREATVAAHAAVTAYTKASGESRNDVEQAVKATVRHATEDPAE